jgi:hypothetical protein
LEYLISSPLVDSFTEGTSNAGLDATLTNTTPPATNAANPAETVDPADIADADLLEALTNGLVATNLEQDRPIESPPSAQQGSIAPQLAPAQRTQPHGNNSDARPPLAIDHFPHGSPGAPVPGSPQGASMYQSSRELFGASCWAPFQSQCDWELACWAKMHGPSSSAMEELLAIPEVCLHRVPATISLTVA